MHIIAHRAIDSLLPVASPVCCLARGCLYTGRQQLANQVAIVLPAAIKAERVDRSTRRTLTGRLGTTHCFNKETFQPDPHTANALLLG